MCGSTCRCRLLYKRSRLKSSVSELSDLIRFVSAKLLNIDHSGSSVSQQFVLHRRLLPTWRRRRAMNFLRLSRAVVSLLFSAFSFSCFFRLSASHLCLLHSSHEGRSLTQQQQQQQQQHRYQRENRKNISISEVSTNLCETLRELALKRVNFYLTLRPFSNAVANNSGNDLS